MKIVWIILLFLASGYLFFIVGPVIASFLAVFRQINPTYPWEDEKTGGDSSLYSEKTRAAVEKMKERPVKHIERKKGKLLLAADYYPGDTGNTLVLCHGFGVCPLTNFAEVACDYLEKGYNVFIPYSRAHAPSRGGRPSLGLLEEEDLIEWIDDLFEHTNTERIVLWGVSMGCAAISYASDKIKDPRVKGMILDCGFESPYGQYARDSKQKRLPVPLMLPIARLIGFCAFHKDIKKPVRESLKSTKLPALFLHGEEDQTVPIEVGRKNFESCASEKVFLSVPGAAHARSYEKLKAADDRTIDRFVKACFNDDTKA